MDAMNKRNKYLHIRIDDALLKQLENLATQDRRSLSDYIYWMLYDESIKRYAKNQTVSDPIKPIFHLSNE